MITVLTISSEFESATRLGYNTITEHGYAGEYVGDVVVRWGNSEDLYDELSNGDTVNTEFVQVINTSEAIRKNVKKDKALIALSKVVDTPEMWQFGESVPSQQVVVYRPVHHAGGDGFNVTKGPFTVLRDYYATSWIFSKTEYRVWFCGDQTMCGTRFQRSECTDKYPCRSMWGYRFEKQVPIELHEATLRAAKTIGLECGAADIMKFREKYYFLELNSAATIDKQVIEDFYKNSLKKLIKKKYPLFI